ncbi:RNA methyltransferase, TrmH family, group 2 [Caldicellulosiruptor obsidiansis OB47]|uniref:Putative tRNA (cytidine(34)-2'-O)-methyltransferase n=1 Tax=Caldicellulosiruptor obsidiansis (strain ATCC BAA-2073 / JCM 16842 / OB47) TaxID=608506 RepID=D9TG62_CALOO|nr:tRNA (uridine(34)/cytosine(34)/5-carboxymethylaminomethyluridine(34)-2'-O)-methyltransferase TrmL [Caldicellulosiruptor obsidiansis]ADL43182.1 RNA methyltransferase, TrmH family, group 2 [Caldicellulosiruptor obsidiansis OB47]
MPINIVLHEPEIPYNTGNIARTCACTGSKLHLIEPLGFSLEDKYLKRAGLDYWQYLDVKIYRDLNDFFEKNRGANIFYFSTKGKQYYTQAPYEDNCYLMFGKETAGLPKWLIEQNIHRTYRIPMISDVRSLNLSNSVAIVLYEVLRQLGFPNLV